MGASPARAASVPDLSEADMVRQLTEAARYGGWLYHHVQRSDYGRQMGLRGFPDLVLLRGPEMFALEVKARRGVMTPEQGRWLDALAAAGALVGIVSPESLAHWLEVLRAAPR